MAALARALFLFCRLYLGPSKECCFVSGSVSAASPDQAAVKQGLRSMDYLIAGLFPSGIGIGFLCDSCCRFALINPFVVDFFGFGRKPSAVKCFPEADLFIAAEYFPGL